MEKNKIGIWGFGLIGKSLLNFLKNNGFQNIEIFDNRDLNNEEKIFLNQNNVPFNLTNLQLFLHRNDFIIPSAGIDISFYYETFKNKFVFELDFFLSFWKKPIIAITGTVGKTSTLNLLERIFKQANINVIAGGNNGKPLFDLISKQSEVDYAILELSSFQLEFSEKFSSQIAIWTNFFPNHLDRHKNIEKYFEAKANILKTQSDKQINILPWEIRQNINQYLKSSEQKMIYFYYGNITDDEISELTSKEILYLIKDGYISKYTYNQKVNLFPLISLPKISYAKNWLSIIAACDALNINLDFIFEIPNYNIPEHRLEYIKTFKEVDYYNDSKSTIIEATLEAVQQFDRKKLIHLIIGGISKGVDRSLLFEKLKNKNVVIYCFGIESEFLFIQAIKFNFKVYKSNTLDEALNNCTKYVNKDEIVLFSPSGASYDQFKNFEERGSYFKQLVQNLI